MANLGSSLSVPCVQELAKKPMETVPSRYVRPERNAPVISDAVLMSRFPVIDMQKLVSEELVESELVKLHCASKEWGFFQLVNHGVSSSLLEKLKKEIHGFFNLEIEEKKKFWQSPGEVEGFGQTFIVSEEQKLDWNDMFLMIIQPPHLRKPHLFHKLPLPLREALEVYSTEVKTLAMALTSKMAKALNMKGEEMIEFFENGLQAMRMNYYPACPEAEKVLGVRSHSDSTGLTILLQLNDVEGLQIKKDGKWIPVTPLPDAFIVNIGDMLEMITNGEYRSIEHRAIVSSEKERLSIATFCNPKYNGEVGPAPSLITEKTPPLFRRLTVEEFLTGLFNRENHDKCYLDTMRLQIQNDADKN